MLDGRSSDRVGIVGLGAIGASIGLALGEAGVSVTGFDVSRMHLGQAVDMGAVERWVPDLQSFGDCAEVVVAVPPRDVVAVASELLRSTDATIVDVASVKAEIVDAIRDPRFIPSHPLRGTHLTGPKAARSDLFDGGVWVLCPHETTSCRSLAAAEGLVRKMGSEPLWMSAREHDVLVATTSHLPHLAASGLVHVLGKRDPMACRLVSGGFLDTTRIARSNPQLWAEITMHNREEITGSIDELIELLAGVRTALAQQDHEGVVAFFSDACHLMDQGLPAPAPAKPQARHVRTSRRVQPLGGRHNSQVVTTVGDAN